jgi:hypothetical protein
MSRIKMILTLTILFIMSLFLIGLGDWLYIITNSYYYHGALIFFTKPYGTLGFAMVGSGVLVLAVAFGLLLDWHNVLIHKCT